MAIDYDRLMKRRFGRIVHAYTHKDTMLYALSVGVGADPLDAACLPFVFENHLKALPSMAVTLAYPGFWPKASDTGIDWVKLLHIGQDIVLHRPLPASGRVEATPHIVSITDKGPHKGALIVSERTVHDADSGGALCTVTTVYLARGDGGFAPSASAPPASAPAPDPIPERLPDYICDLPTLPQAALLYRLASGDFNPLHAAPAIARQAGFDRPVLHGLCTFGVACHALVKTLCDYDPARLQRLRARFSAPVYPGDTIRTEIWRKGAKAAFRCRVMERNTIVINHGYAELRHP